MFRRIAKNLIAALLRAEARLVIKKYKPKIVGITGSVGKTGTKEAVAAALAAKYRVRRSEKSFNHDLGVPLTILGCPNAWWSFSGWIKNLVEGASLILFRSPYPEWLVLEVGVEKSGDIARLSRWIKFDIVILTRLPEIPVHVEFFSSSDDLVREKLALARSLGPEGLAILNADDPKIMAARESLSARVLTYGWSESAAVRGSNEHILYVEVEGRKLPDGLALKVDYAGHSVPFRLRGILAHHQLYGVLAAVAAGVSLGINLVDLAEALENLETPPGRFRLLPGVKETIIIDDSYNASPAAVESALATLKKMEISDGRRIAVLGDMMELGHLTADAHRQIGALASETADLLVTIGIRSKFMEETARKKRMAKERLKHFDTWEGAGEWLEKQLRPGDIVLVKGSQSMRLEKVVEEIMAHPEDKERLLVRQEPEWLKR